MMAGRAAPQRHCRQKYWKSGAGWAEAAL